jgi:hypothetical protein
MVLPLCEWVVNIQKKEEKKERKAKKRKSEKGQSNHNIPHQVM